MKPVTLVVTVVALSVLTFANAKDVAVPAKLRTATKATPVPLPAFIIEAPVPVKCPKALVKLGGACQCHLIKIRAIGLFKKISEEGLTQGCLSKFGPRPRWKRACRRLTRSRRFKKRKSIKAVRRIVDKCGAPLCNFFVTL